MQRLFGWGPDRVAGSGWAIGIYRGDSPCRLSPAPENPVLTCLDVHDARTAFVADPFMVREDGIWWLFFEALNLDRRKGEIGLAASPDGVSWEYRGIVLQEPYHLSYPYVFEWHGDHFMVPESHVGNEVRLYRARSFPTRWDHCATLLAGSFADSSPFHFEGRWWMFTSPISAPGNCELYMAAHLEGPWQPHPSSPIVRDDRGTARPGGRVLIENGRPIRHAQDGIPQYGSRVRAFAVTELTPVSYREAEIPESPVLVPAPAGWNRSGMHHIDPHPAPGGGWLACVDGQSFKDRSP
jgi:hypothetical protein